MTDSSTNRSIIEFGSPGEMRDRLVTLVVAGVKVATSALLVHYEDDGIELPRVGDRSIVVDSAGKPVTTIETTRVELVPIGEVTLALVLAEGEGYSSVAEWRTAHEAFWLTGEGVNPARLLRSDWQIPDATVVVTEYFQLAR